MELEVLGRDFFLAVVVVALGRRDLGSGYSAGTGAAQGPQIGYGTATRRRVSPSRPCQDAPGAHGWLAAETAPWLQGLRYSVLGRHAALLVVAEAAPRRSLFRYACMDWWRRLQVAAG
jgi:hypothetical protein